jgi:hypothetical protein
VCLEGQPLCHEDHWSFKKGLRERGYFFQRTDDLGNDIMSKEIYPFIVEISISMARELNIIGYAVYMKNSILEKYKTIENNDTRIITGAVFGLHNEIEEHRFNKDLKNVSAKWVEDEYGFSLYMVYNGDTTKVISSN